MDVSTSILNLSNETGVTEIWSNLTQNKESNSLDGWSYYITLGILLCLGFFSNLTAIVFLIKDLKKAPVPTNVLICCLCLTDLISVCNSCVWTAFHREMPAMPSPLCEIQSVLNPFLPMCAGIMSVFMALDRLLALHVPFFYQKITISKTLLSVLCFAVFNIILCSLPLFGLGNIWSVNVEDGIIKYKCENFFFKEIPHQRIFGFGFVAMGFIVTTTIIVLNVIVLIIAVRLHNRVQGLQIASSESRIKLSHELQFAKLVGALTFVFVVCWTPFNVELFLQEMGILMNPKALGVIHTLAGLNYIIDPFVYIFIRKSFRQRLAKMCCRCKHQITPMTATENGQQINDN